MGIGSNQETYRRGVCQTCSKDRVCRVMLIGAGIYKVQCGPCYKATQEPVRKQLAALAELKAKWMREAGEVG